MLKCHCKKTSETLILSLLETLSTNYSVSFLLFFFSEQRQGLVTDKMPLHVLVERHLPLEYRKLLIPVAVSGNKVIPYK